MNPVTPAQHRPDNISHDRLLRADPKSPMTIITEPELRKNFLIGGSENNDQNLIKLNNMQSSKTEKMRNSVV